MFCRFRTRMDGNNNASSRNEHEIETHRIQSNGHSLVAANYDIVISFN